MLQTNEQTFSKWRAMLWPIHRFEYKKVFPMLIMAFCVSFNYTVLRDTKDTIVVSAIDELALPFLKLFGTLPMAVLFVLTFSKLSNMLRRDTLFYAVIAPFIVFFFLFATVFYPYQEQLQLTRLADCLLTMLPEGFHSAIECIRHWPLAMFYIAAELWSSAVLSLLFWGFANRIVRTCEAKRFYSIFCMGINIAPLFSGALIFFFSVHGKKLAAIGINPWQYSLNMLMGMAIVSGFIIVSTYWWINRNVLTDSRLYEPDQEDLAPKKQKPKMGVFESLAYLAKSRYLICIAILVFGYGMSINLIEVVWKGQLKAQFTNENDYSAFMGIFSMCMGTFSISVTLFSGYIMRQRTWASAASITPMMLLTTGTFFFIFIIFKQPLQGLFAMLGTTSVIMAVIVGMVQNIMCKAMKYCFFDPTKEMAYIPLDSESKVKGKAAIDVVGARLGKSGGSLVWNFLAFTLVSMFGRDLGKAIATPIVACLLIGIIFVWLLAIRSLSGQYEQLTRHTIRKNIHEEQEDEIVSTADKAKPLPAT